MTARQKALLSAQAAYDKKADNVRLLNVANVSGFADYFLICSAESHRQVQALGDAIEKQLAQVGSRPLSVEGTGQANWLLMDYSDLIVHIFRTETREFYGLDQLWGDAPRVRISAATVQRQVKAAMAEPADAPASPAPKRRRRPAPANRGARP